jgi:hypothetical protein
MFNKFDQLCFIGPDISNMDLVQKKLETKMAANTKEKIFKTLKPYNAATKLGNTRFEMGIIYVCMYGNNFSIN